MQSPRKKTGPAANPEPFCRVFLATIYKEATMSDVTRRDAAKLAAGLALGAGILGTERGLGQEPKKGEEPQKRPDLDAVLRVEVTDKGFIKLVFETPGKDEQSFDSTGYRYAVLDKDGVQIGRTRSAMAMVSLALNVHPVVLPQGERTVTLYGDYTISRERLRTGEEYYLIVSVRNLTGLAKFKS